MTESAHALSESEKLEFKESLRALTDGIVARVKEVGLEQAAEEYWEKAKKELTAIFNEFETFRKEHNISEDEL